MPSCVVFPGSTEEVSSVLRVAGDLGTPVIPRGAGTNLSAGTVAHRGEVMLVLTRMKRLLELDAENLAAVCQPGCRRRSSEPPPSSEACSARRTREAARRRPSAATSPRTPAGCATILEDATVPRSRLAEMVRRIEEIAARHDLVIGTSGHAGDGNLHPTCLLDPLDGAAIERAHRAFDEIFAAALELGGTITGEHGVGLAKLPWLERAVGAEHIALLWRIKAAFDPQGILNPGKLRS